jgi:large subunit ribosomal protein L10
MAITREKKKDILQKLGDILSTAESVTLVNFHGLDVGKTTEMRAGLRAQGVNYYVAKKTLIKKALKDSGIPGEIPVLDGELALSYGDDATASAREVHNFAKENEGKVQILGGIFEGMLRDKEGMMEIATIPSEHVLRGMFANVINSPIQGLVVALGQIRDAKEA